ncbi:lycopene cyclase family protein [Flavobacteriaceae bacterium S0825]|uniref:lycopene cyclase family protein n=1 Tax=Gaetbulibacter sp. S0825 TaxID=2720084 RepID=UPI001431DBD6|nr:lycopene cyclase family protein [Gaetbulibacter sp. S0825]MCK0109105.1 lycopene cyclase family protein [Flavobacteriaceae bacterium S0825]NIX64740.1 lycopene cyclase [Gaetbulibacter sp. S0825]
MKDDSKHFDYIIIGNGLAGLQLALKLASDSFFNHKQIALIDQSTKNKNDKTWSFWEVNSTQWDSIIHKFWGEASVITSNETIDLKLQPYTYKTIRAINFYNEVKTKLKNYPNIHFIIDKVKSVIENDLVKIETTKKSYSATHVFDSRIPEEFLSLSKKYISITQHFKGWVIKTKDNVFDENKVIMMDYRLKDGEQTTFTYVLPFSKTEALVEFTYFTEHLVEDDVYNYFLKQYINDYLKIDDYTIIETEKGQIPMTNFPFEKFNTNRITKIGTGGGWVKGTTGYSFKHTEKKVSQIITNIKANKTPSNRLFKRKYKFYDKVFLKVLKDENDKGEWIFQQFYSKNSVQTMFRFLDEESTLLEDLKIMWSLFSWSFIKAFLKTL